MALLFEGEPRPEPKPKEPLISFTVPEEVRARVRRIREYEEKKLGLEIEYRKIYRKLIENALDAYERENKLTSIGKLPPKEAAKYFPVGGKDDK